MIQPALVDKGNASNLVKSLMTWKVFMLCNLLFLSAPFIFFYHFASVRAVYHVRKVFTVSLDRASYPQWVTSEGGGDHEPAPDPVPKTEEPAPAVVPPAVATGPAGMEGLSLAEKLQQIKETLEAGLISEEEAAQLKQHALSSMASDLAP